ncbi:hypothetical protein [Bordetella genomosp. 11]|uniref:Uncharacterized protein n=1 Tax=Bordetella genomosp. 11 TaxID=1416808 RepID=A0A261UF05_9BORD|nr:hypothetical protein [Bordetella genomosp. 11]OZI59453.1 hypothetical protein CAL28_07855 [Bordetella genomosp. 11]
MADRLAKADARSGDTPANADARREMAASLTAAFVEHARVRLGLAAEDDAARVIAAFFAASPKPDTNAAGRWLEHDADLMLCLARACRLFAHEPAAADLGPGQRRLLANGLALALTDSIDWPAALNADAADGTAVFYDGLTLRNANKLSIEDAAAAIEARIGKTLAASAATRGFAPIVAQLRVALIGDPTLSFEPLSPSPRYGSRDWVKLWIGIQACAAAGVDATAMTAAQVSAFGQAIDIDSAQQNHRNTAPPPLAQDQAETGQRPPLPQGEAAHPVPLPSQIGLLLMAHAAGQVDLMQLREGEQAAIAEKVQAFAADEFRTELALGEAIDRLLALDPPPSARGIAEDALRDQGLDPMAIVIEEPISSKGRRESHKLHEFYVKFNDLAEIEPNRFNRKLIAKTSRDAPLYKDLYERKFDAYIADYLDAHKKMLGLMLDTAARDGFQSGDSEASVSIHRARITSHPGAQAHGFFVTCTDAQRPYRYFVSPGGTIETIPDQVDHQDWLVQNRHSALTQEDLNGIKRASGSDMAFSCVLEQTFSGEASRIGDAVDAHFRPGLLELKKHSTPIQDGISKADRVLETIVPFYGTYTSMKRGEYASAYISFVTGVFALIPTAFAASKLVGVSRKALVGGIRVALGSLAGHGPVNSAGLGFRHAGAHLPSMGLHAMHTAGTLLDTLCPVPVGTRSFGELFARAYRHLKPTTLRRIADAPGQLFSGRTRTTAPPTASPTTFTLLPGTGARPPVPVAPGGQGIPIAGNAQPPFVKAADAEGGTRWLRRVGSAYAQFDPHRLHPVGPVLVRGRKGALTPSLHVTELAHHAVSDPATLSMLARARVSAQGTVTLDDRIFAPIAGAYIEIAPRTPTPVGEPPAWYPVPAVARAASDAAEDMPTLLTYHPGQGGWIDLAHRARDVALPPGVLDRYRVADAGLREALARARVSGDGTIMLGARRYAPIHGDYLELVADHAASTPERPVWRIAGAPLSGTRNGTPRLAWDKDLRVWREPRRIPALRGGGALHSAPAGAKVNPIKRVIVDEDTMKSMAERIVMQHDGGVGLIPIRLKNTETVHESERVLREATDLTRYPWWEEEFDDYLGIMVLDLEKSAYAKVDPRLADAADAGRFKREIEEDMRTFLTDLYARSETFRGLVNNAKAKGRLKKDRAWTIHISLPATLKNGKAILADEPLVAGAMIPGSIDTGVKKIVVPEVKSPPFFSTGQVLNQERKVTLGIIVDGGKHAPQQAPSCIVHEFMHFLTLKDDPAETWDRGAVEYLAQRILKEAGYSQPRRLTYTTPIDGNKAFEYGKTQVERLHRYVDAQDEYLKARFPMPDPPTDAWNPSQGNERWGKVDTTTAGDFFPSH